MLPTDDYFSVNTLAFLRLTVAYNLTGRTGMRVWYTTAEARNELSQIYEFTKKERLAEGHGTRSKAIWKLVRDKVQKGCLWEIYGEPEEIDEPPAKRSKTDGGDNEGGSSGCVSEEEEEEEELECE
jgi:hypothetical protein